MNQKNLFRQLMAAIVICILAPISTNTLAEETLTVIGWNAESGDANSAVIAEHISNTNGCDIWGICEVLNSSWAAEFENAAEDGENADFESILGQTGSSDKMLIIYDANRFELVRHFELHRINISGTVRAPLVAHFKTRQTNIEFLFMINHLYRTKTARRHEQSQLLNCWASEQKLPIIAVGDYNFDWDVEEGDSNHDKGYDNMVKDGHFNWVRPKQLKKTQANPNYNSVLDFVFLGGNSWTWKATSSILKRDDNDNNDDNFSDNSQSSDHRPVMATIIVE